MHRRDTCVLKTLALQKSCTKVDHSWTVLSELRYRFRFRYFCFFPFELYFDFDVLKLTYLFSIWLFMIDVTSNLWYWICFDDDTLFWSVMVDAQPGSSIYLDLWQLWSFQPRSLLLYTWIRHSRIWIYVELDILIFGCIAMFSNLIIMVILCIYGETKR